MLLGIEDILSELVNEEVTAHGFPPGFRFHPTDEELITFYLASKVLHGSFCPADIAEVDLNKCEPWDLPDAGKMGKREWYFYSLRDRKYPTGLRTNRATSSGYWKATGKDREIHSAVTGALIGMKKTLVFYLGRAPRGDKTKWVMHEYRLHSHFLLRSAAKEEWVICRIYHKTGEKKKMLLNEVAGSQLQPPPSTYTTTACSMARNHSFLPQLIDRQLMSNQFLHNQTSRQPQMYNNNNPLESKLGSYPAYSSQPESSYYPAAASAAAAAATSVNTPLPSTLFTSLLTGEDPHCQKQAEDDISEQVKAEPDFQRLLPGADDLEWFHELQQAASNRYNNHPLYAIEANNAGESCSTYSRQISDAMDSNRGGCLQMVVDPNFRIPNGESWASHGC